MSTWARTVQRTAFVGASRCRSTAAAATRLQQQQQQQQQPLQRQQRQALSSFPAAGSVGAATAASPPLLEDQDDQQQQQQQQQQARPWSDIPGPRPAPLVGNAWRFVPRIGNYAGLKQKDFMRRLHDEFGPVVKLGGMLGAYTLHMVKDPDDFEKVLRTEGQWPERRGLASMEYYQRAHRTNLPESIITSQGKTWGDFRSAVNQVMMQPRNVRRYAEPIDLVTVEFIQRMRDIRDANGQMPEDFSDEVAKWAMESITFVALDTRLGALGNSDPNSEGRAVIQALKDMFYYVHQLDFRPSVWKYVTTPSLRGLVRSMDYLNKFAEKYVAAAMQRLKADADEAAKRRQAGGTEEAAEDGAGGGLTVLQRLLLNNDDPAKAVAMAVDMITAGSDTTSVGTTVVMYHLAKHPEQQRRLQEELDRVLPDGDTPLTVQRLEQLKYLKACIKESLRLEPVTPNNMRTTGKDLVLGGYHLPKGSTVVMNNFLVCEDARYFPRPLDFLPERWLAEGAALKARHPFAYLPFGFGPRMCVGRRFADLEMEIMTARVFKNFTLEWHHPPPQTDVMAVLRYESPLRFTVRDRV